MSGSHTRLLTQKVKPKFIKHQVHETAETLTESRHIAANISDAERYPFRARVTLIGNALVKPYMPIYLDGLPNGMTGYWTVLEVTHRLESPLRYWMSVVVGTDEKALSLPAPVTSIPQRDVAQELSGNALSPGADTVLVDYSSALMFDVSARPTAPIIDGAPRQDDLYQDSAPDFTALPSNIYWSAQ